VVWTLLYADTALSSALSLSTLEHEGRHDEATVYPGHWQRTSP